MNVAKEKLEIASGALFVWGIFSPPVAEKRAWTNSGTLHQKNRDNIYRDFYLWWVFVRQKLWITLVDFYKRAYFIDFD